MLQRVAEAVTLHRMFERGHRVGIAVSGGADSVCLLHVLVELAPAWDLKLSVLHVDHQLRDESGQDADFVRELAAGLGLPVHCHEADVRRISEMSRDNLEQAARRVRREFFLRFLNDGALNRVALGHTRSDQAETVLLRFLRGAGTAGLAGMRPVTPEGFVRPLLELDRAEVVRFLTSRSIAWRDDPTNCDRAFDRNRVRHDLLPALEREWNPALGGILAGLARVAQDEEDHWKPIVEQEVTVNIAVRNRAVLFRAEWLARLPRALARRVTRRAVELARGDLRSIDLRHIEAILALAALPGGSARVQVPGLDVFRSFDWMRLAPREAEDRDYSRALEVPGRFPVPGSGRGVVLELIEPLEQAGERLPGACGYNGLESDLDWGRVSGALVLRNWRPGDHYRPSGHANDTKIKSLFQDNRIPLWERRGWPVITRGDEIVWAARFGAAAEYAATAGSRTVLRVREIDQTAEFS